jgi:hypothetical protein
LDFIKNEDSSNLITPLAKSRKELRSCGIDTAFSLDGLHDNTTGLVRDELLELLDVIVVAVLEAGHHR